MSQPVCGCRHSQLPWQVSLPTIFGVVFAAAAFFATLPWLLASAAKASKPTAVRIDLVLFVLLLLVAVPWTVALVARLVRRLATRGPHPYSLLVFPAYLLVGVWAPSSRLLLVLAGLCVFAWIEIRARRLDHTHVAAALLALCATGCFGALLHWSPRPTEELLNERTCCSRYCGTGRGGGQITIAVLRERGIDVRVTKMLGVVEQAYCCHLRLPGRHHTVIEASGNTLGEAWPPA